MSVDQYKKNGNSAFSSKNYKEAVTQYTNALELDHTSENAGAIYGNRSASYLELKDFARALEDADLCIKLRPTWFKGYFRRGAALVELKRLDEAAEAYQKALKVDPKNADAKPKLADVNETIKKRNANATPAGCNAAEAKMIGISLYKTGKSEKAIEFFKHERDLYENDSTSKSDKANSYANLAACYQQIRNYKEVVSNCNEALALEPDHSKALLRRAIAYQGLGKWKDALKDYEALDKLSPGSANIYQGITQCKEMLKK